MKILEKFNSQQFDVKNEECTKIIGGLGRDIQVTGPVYMTDTVDECGNESCGSDTQFVQTDTVI